MPVKARRSVCPISSALDVFGDKWSLLIIRDFFAGKTSYSEFLSSPEKISTNILSSRLRLLEEQGLVAVGEKSTRTGKPVYRLTEKGKRLHPVLDAIAAWALENIEGTEKLIAVGE